MAGKWQQTNEPCVYVQVYTRSDPKTGKVEERKRWKAAFRAVSNGRPVVTSRTFDRRGDAVAFVAQNRVNARRGEATIDVMKSRKTVAEAWDHLVKTWRKKPSTLARYTSDWKVHIEPALGSRRLVKVQRAELEAFYTDLEQRTTLETRRKVQQIVHKIFAVAVQNEWLIRNPAHGIEMPQAAPEREPHALTEAEVEQLAGEVPARYRAFVWMLAETGARPGEVIALRVKNLNGSVRIVEATAEMGGRRITGSPKTKGSIRNVPISPRLRDAIRDHYNAGFANRFDPESYVFTGERGAQISQANLRKRVLQPAARRVGIEGFVTYDLRHTAISLWLMRGLTPWEVAKMVGHVNLKMIEQRYGHLYEHELQKKIDRVGVAGEGRVIPSG